ncbi:BatA domain-containing protein [Pedobacter deserti]|uniref:BatA domain-containing protein n=1 Tax=Pedobacter deserti TaxID=2817382 RepID=UPI00210E8A55|nr:BatA domain-containing protein [Pedobacter sp. SYSU D00382]
MNFLYPGFLFALGAIVIPIVIHLFNFRKLKRVYFSNVQFLVSLQQEQATGRKLKHRLVLLSRILAIVFLVLAFARPYISAGDQAVSPDARTVVSVYVDNSYSMQTLNPEGTLLDEAKRKAAEIAKTYRLNDRFQLITNDFEGRHQRLVDRQEFIDLLGEVNISPSSRNLQQVIYRQQTDAVKGQNQVFYLLSDFQKSFLGKKPVAGFVPAAGYHFVKLDANSQPNIAVDTLWSLSPVQRSGQPVQLVVQLKNFGMEDAEQVPLKLSIGGRQKAVRTVSVPALRTVKDTLSFSGLNAGWQKAELRITDYPLTFDDVLNFSFPVSTKMPVLHISGDLSSPVIRSLFGADPYFELKEMPEGNIQYSALSNYHLIVVSGLKHLSAGMAAELKTQVQSGASLIIFPDTEIEPPVYNAFLAGLSLPQVKELHKEASLRSSADLSSELFDDVFEQIPAQMDLPQVTRYFEYGPAGKLGRQNILSLPLNRGLLSGYLLGDGRVYLSAVSLSEEDSNLARHPIFLPLMFKAAFSSSRPQPLFYIAGRDNLLETRRISLPDKQVPRLSTGTFEVIPEVRQSPGKTTLYVADQIREAGFYDLKLGDSTLAVMAFNDNRLESDMTYASDSELRTLAGKAHGRLLNAKTDTGSISIHTRGEATEFWKLCAIFAILCLIAEVLLIRFYDASNKQVNKTII